MFDIITILLLVSNITDPDSYPKILILSSAINKQVPATGKKASPRPCTLRFISVCTVLVTALKTHPSSGRGGAIKIAEPRGTPGYFLPCTLEIGLPDFFFNYYILRNDERTHEQSNVYFPSSYAY